MSDVSAATLQLFHANHPNFMEPVVSLNSVEFLLEKHSVTDLGNAATQFVMDLVSESIKTLIVNSNMPQGVEDKALAQVDSVMAEMREQCPCSPEALADLQNSEMAEELTEVAQAAIDVLVEALSDTMVVDEAAIETETEGAGGAEGAGETEAAGGTEGADEPPAAPGGDLKEAADAALDSLLAETGESPSTTRSGGKSFLEILAQSMGEAQAKMLNKALEYSNQMRDMAGDEEKADLFTIAQAQYTALMQMFNIYSNQVATTLKTLGEAMAGIARKQ